MFPNFWQAECSGGGQRLAWKQSGLRQTLNATLSKVDNLVWLPPQAKTKTGRGDPLLTPPLCTLKRLHGDLLQQYDCTEQAAPQPPPPSAGSSAAANAGAHPQPPAGSQDNSNGKLLL